MFERFSQTARQAVVNAQEEARSLGHSHIGTEHELLGLLADPASPACHVLGSSGVTLNGARERLLERVGLGKSEYPASGYIPLTARATVVYERSLVEAVSLGHRTVTPEHLLLGLTHEDEGVVVAILVDCGSSRITIRERLLTMLSDRDP